MEHNTQGARPSGQAAYYGNFNGPIDQQQGVMQPSPQASPSQYQVENYMLPQGQPYLDGNGFTPCPTVTQQEPFTPQAPSLSNDDSAYATGSTHLGSLPIASQTYQLDALDFTASSTDTNIFPTQSGIAWEPLWENEQYTEPFDPNMYLPRPDSPCNRPQFNGKRARSIISDSTDDSASSTKRAKQPKYRSAADAINIPAGQESILQSFVDRFKLSEQPPTKKELQSMADVVHIPFHEVCIWFGAKAQLAPTRSPEPGLGIASQTLNTEIAQLIHEYIVKHNNQACKASNGQGIYRCTWADCSYSAQRRNAWEQHEETKQPQRFWVCADCLANAHDATKPPHINHRGDKFLEHATLHNNDLDYRLKLRERSEVDYVAPFRRSCTFKIRGRGVCNHRFTSWHERMEHYARHYKDEQSATGAIRPRGQQGRDKTDDGNNHKTAERREATGASPRTTSGQIMKRSKSSPSATSTPATSDRSNLPGCFIDVLSLDVRETDVQARYVALKYDGPRLQELLLLVHEFAASSRAGATSQVPPALHDAIALTRQMGVANLWVDFLGDAELDSYDRDEIYRRSSFIIVAGMLRKTMRVTHFACGFDQLATVQAWMYQDVTLRRLHLLGQGAYSVVDKIEVSYYDESRFRLSSKCFARKTILRQISHGISQRPTHLHEMEIMRKFSHPHIAEFVAAYLQDNSLHILMSPVAEYDMRHFLSNPQQYPEEQAFLPQWFVCLADALSHMHSLDCRHKDIKPANILISQHKVLLTDFGTSTQFANDQSMTSGNALMTPKYCAPEVAALQSRGRSADIWSLGCVFLEMLTVLQRKSLGDLHAAIRIDSTSIDRQHTYHSQIPGLKSWLQAMRSEQLDEHVSRLISCTERMLSHPPARRPTSKEIVQMICGKTSCEHCKPLCARVARGDCHCGNMKPNRSVLTGLSLSSYHAQTMTLQTLHTSIRHSLPRQTPDLKILASCTGNLLHLKHRDKYWNVTLDFFGVDSSGFDSWSLMKGELYPIRESAKSDAERNVSGVINPTNLCFRGHVGRLLETEIDAQCLDNRESVYFCLPWLKPDDTGRPYAIDQAQLLRMLGSFAATFLTSRQAADCLLVHRWCKAQVEALRSAEDATCWIVKFGETQAHIDKTGYRGLSILVNSPDSGTFAQPSYGQGSYPSRLVDCGRSDDEIRLVETRGQSAQYIALSYCWRDQKILRTKLHNYSAFTESLPTNLLPVEVSDAVRMTRDLGFQYLWIDSLCIVHDDVADLSSQVTAMGQIYEKAAITLVITPNHSAQQRSTVSESASMGITSTSREISTSYLPRRPRCTYCHSSWGGKWTVQDSLLSTRVLHVSSRWLFYESDSGCTIADRAAISSIAIPIHSKHSWSVLDAMRKCTLQEVKIA